jgi:hypothetical protein
VARGGHANVYWYKLHVKAKFKPAFHFMGSRVDHRKNHRKP